jgi:hypothetical protein
MIIEVIKIKGGICQNSYVMPTFPNYDDDLTDLCVPLTAVRAVKYRKLWWAIHTEFWWRKPVGK